METYARKRNRVSEKNYRFVHPLFVSFHPSLSAKVEKIELLVTVRGKPNAQGGAPTNVLSHTNFHSSLIICCTTRVHFVRN